MARLQSIVLNTVVLLVQIVEDAQMGSLLADSAAEVAKSAILLLGNASAHADGQGEVKKGP